MNTRAYAKLDPRLMIVGFPLIGILGILLAAGGLSKPAVQTSTFSFTAQGDHGSTMNTTLVLNAIAASGSSFTLALGDLSYTTVGAEGDWCNYVISLVGPTPPFELIAGNHEDDARANGWIGNFIQCLPDRLGVTGVYGAEYYFDYNQVRFILASAASSVDGVNYDYNTIDGARYNWMRDRIREGQAAGEWVIVGMHKNCLTPGTKACEIGQNFLNLLINEHVDLVLQGHDHVYARSKQLTCATVNSYDAACVADADDTYTRGEGTAIVIDGVAGSSFYNINANDNERNYFVKAMGGNGNWDFVTGASSPDKAFGTLKVTVSDTQLAIQFLAGAGTGNFTDSFSIVGAAGPTVTPAPSATPIPTSTPTPTPTATPLPIGPLHIGDLDSSGTSSGSKWNALVTITVHDVNHNPVAGASVTGVWSGSFSGSAACTTDSSGQCTVSKRSLKSSKPSITFTIGNVTQGALTYNPADNHDPDGDSDGTRITVNRP
jgi:hypothetical protein